MSCPYALAPFGRRLATRLDCALFPYQTSSVLRQIICGRTLSSGRSAMMP